MSSRSLAGVLAAGALCLTAATGCGGSDGDGEAGGTHAADGERSAAKAAPALKTATGPDRSPVRTADPATTFAPLVRFARDEPFRPVRGRWFIERSTLRWLPGAGCRRHPPVAAGTVVDQLGLVEAPWMFASRLGRSIGYSHAAPAGRGCAGSGRTFYANQLNRPHDTTPGRAPGLRRDQGFYLDLLDDRRGGPPPTRDGRIDSVGGEAMFERRRTTVGGKPGLRITYWLLFGMSRPTGPDGEPVPSLTHEGDWERVQVLLRRTDSKRTWKPFAVRLRDERGGWRRVPWAAVRRVAESGGRPTHPELFAARGSHTLYPRPGRYERSVGTETVVDVAAEPCDGCARMEMWKGLGGADADTWYGFGGAWGEAGPTSATTGPLGPHGGYWPAGNQEAQMTWRNRHFGQSSR